MQLVPVARSARFVELSFAIRAVLEINQWTRWQILCRAFLSLFAWSLACHAIAAKPVVYDTGYEIFRKIVSPSMYWVDSERLLFEGINTSDMNVAVAKHDRHRVKRLTKLYLWDKKTTSVRMYAEGSALCVANGIVHYTAAVRSANGQKIVREGPLGSEREVELDITIKKKSTDPIFGQLACKSLQRGDLVPPPGRYRNVVVLRDGHRYLDLGPNIGADLSLRRAHPRNLVLYAGSGAEATKLPLTWDEDFSPFDVLYSEYLGAYILRPRAPRGAQIGLSQPWPKNEPLIVYSLWPDGRVATTSVPYRPTEFLTNPLPVTTGWIFGGGNFYRASGLYLFNGKAVTKLDSGLVKEIAVSPDGCAAAAAIQSKHLDMGTPTNLKIFALCARAP